MRNDVSNMLSAAARRLLLVRVAEAATVGAIAAGLGAAVGELAWSLDLPGWAAAFGCAAAGLMAAGLVARPGVQRSLGLHPAMARTVGVICGAIGLAEAACLLAGGPEILPAFALPLALVPAGALAAAGVRAIRGVTPMEAAVFHDAKQHLDERLSTAAELASAPGPDEPFERCVFAQATEAVDAERLRRQALWRRTPATAGALGLSLALCAALAFLPSPSSAMVEASFQRIRAFAADSGPGAKADLIAALRQLAEQIEKDPELRRRLREAALAVEKPGALSEALAEVEAALADADDAVAARIARSLLESLGLGPAEDGAAGAPKTAGGEPDPPTAADANAIIGNGDDKPLAARVFVYDASYAGVPDANAPTAADPNTNAAAFVHLTDAWTAARARASTALAAGAVPPEYRTLIRKFFELQ